MKTTKIILAAMTALALTACSSDDEQVFTPAEGEIQLQMVHPAQTRATDTSFENTDEIGVYVTTADSKLQLGGNVVNNEKFVYNGTSWSSPRKVYWNKGNHNIYAYYPYSDKVNDVEDYQFSVQTDQSTAEGYTKSDFLWASVSNQAATNTAVKMQFAHKLSCVNVVLEKGESYEGEIPTNTEVYLYSTVPDALISLTTGDACKDSYGATASIRCFQESATRYKAIVVPQNLTSRRPIVEVVIGNVSYLMEGTISYKPGMRHTLTVTLEQDPEQIKISIGGEIEGWN